MRSLCTAIGLFLASSLHSFGSTTTVRNTASSASYTAASAFTFSMSENWMAAINDSSNWAIGDVFNLFDWASLGTTGNFDTTDLDLPTLGAGFTWDTSMFTTNGAIVVGTGTGSSSSGSGTVVVSPPNGGSGGVVVTPPDGGTGTDPGGNIDDPADMLDADVDGMDDAWELDNGLDPADETDADKDADGDGLTNLEEYEFGTDPNKKDTDGGGASDFSEWVLNQAVQAVNDLLNCSGGNTGGDVGIWPGEDGGDGTDVIIDDSTDIHTGGIIQYGINTGGYLDTNMGHGVIRPNFSEPAKKKASTARRGGKASAGSLQIGNTTGSTLLDGFISGSGSGKGNGTGGGTTGTGESGIPGITQGTLIDLLDIASNIETEGYDPIDDVDDASAKKVIADLKKLNLWEPLVGLVTGELTIDEVIQILLGNSVVIPTGVGVNNFSGGNAADNLGASTDTGSPVNSAGRSAAKSNGTSNDYGGGGGGSSSSDSTSPSSTGSTSGGSRGSSSASGGGGSSGSAGGSSGGASHVYVSSVNVSAPSAPIGHPSGPPPMASHHDVSDHEHHHKDHGDSDSSSSSSTKTSKPAQITAATPKPSSGSSGGWLFMGIVPALGFVARRLLSAAI